MMITVTRPNGDLLWRGEASQATLAPDGTFTFRGAAQPIRPPYSIEVLESEEDESNGSKA